MENIFETKNNKTIIIKLYKIVNITVILEILFFILKYGVKKFKSSHLYYFLMVSANAGLSIKNKLLKDNYYINEYNNCKIFTRKGYISSDVEVFNQVLGRREYEICVQVLIEKFERIGSTTIFDLGSNIGLTSLYFDYKLPNSTIYSIEPDQANFDILKLNTKSKSNIILVNGGIWNRDCILEIDNSIGDTRDWSITTNLSVSEFGIKGYCLNNLIKSLKISEIDILKIDIEGAEKMIFENNSYSHKFLSLTKVIAIEIHDDLVERNIIESILIQNNFTFWNTSDFTIGYNLNKI